MKPEPLESTEWCDRCARRLVELDRQLTTNEAQAIAEDVYDFERTRVMEPEAAADFVATEMRRPDRQRFERRSADRPQRRPILKSILRFLATPSASPADAGESRPH